MADKNDPQVRGLWLIIIALGLCCCLFAYLAFFAPKDVYATIDQNGTIGYSLEEGDHLHFTLDFVPKKWRYEFNTNSPYWPCAPSSLDKDQGKLYFGHPKFDCTITASQKKQEFESLLTIKTPSLSKAEAGHVLSGFDDNPDQDLFVVSSCRGCGSSGALRHIVLLLRKLEIIGIWIQDLLIKFHLGARSNDTVPVSSAILQSPSDPFTCTSKSVPIVGYTFTVSQNDISGGFTFAEPGPWTISFGQDGPCKVNILTSGEGRCGFRNGKIVGDYHPVITTDKCTNQTLPTPPYNASNSNTFIITP